VRQLISALEPFTTLGAVAGEAGLVALRFTKSNVKCTMRQVLATPRGAPLLVLRGGALVAGRQYLFSLSAACPGEVLSPCSPCKTLYTTLAKSFTQRLQNALRGSAANATLP
jgi:hypothetical protein